MALNMVFYCVLLIITLTNILVKLDSSPTQVIYFIILVKIIINFLLVICFVVKTFKRNQLKDDPPREYLIPLLER